MTWDQWAITFALAIAVFLMWYAIYLMHMGLLFPERKVAHNGHIRRHISRYGYWPEAPGTGLIISPDPISDSALVSATRVDLHPVFSNSLLVNDLFYTGRKAKAIPLGSARTWFRPPQSN